MKDDPIRSGENGGDQKQVYLVELMKLQTPF